VINNVNCLLIYSEHSGQTKALLIWLIIRLIQLVFSTGTVFFSHKKSANSVFQLAYNSSRTAPEKQKQFVTHKHCK
jgi:hypothetical protein